MYAAVISPTNSSAIRREPKPAAKRSPPANSSTAMKTAAAPGSGMPSWVKKPVTSNTVFFLRPGMQIEFPKIAAGQENADPVILHQTGRDSCAKRWNEAAAKPFLDDVAAFAKRLKEQTPALGSGPCSARSLRLCSWASRIPT